MKQTSAGQVTKKQGASVKDTVEEPSILALRNVTLSRPVWLHSPHPLLAIHGNTNL